MIQDSAIEGLARIRLVEFITYLKPTYQPKGFHRFLCRQLEKIEDASVRRLMISVPPQHGKSEIATRTFPSWLIGKDPLRKVVICSYSSTLAEGFNRDNQRLIKEEGYSRLFPGANVPRKGSSSTANTELCEIVNEQGSPTGGYIKAVGVGGSLTGFPMDIGIIDDPLKDRAAALSSTIRESLWSWYTDVFETRMHNDSRQVVIQTRWHEADLCGKLLTRDGIYNEITNPTGWVVINLQALRTENEQPFDRRQVGQPLWPERHSREKLEAVRDKNSVTFNSLYQGDPKPNPDALVHSTWRTADKIPDECEVLFCGLDFGYTNDPTSLVLIGKTGNRLYCHELIYQTGLTNTELARRIHLLKLPPRIQIYADSAEPKSIAELKTGVLSAEGEKVPGLNVLPALKGPDSITAGLSRLQDFEVYLTGSSINLIRERNNYQWIMMGSVPTNDPIDAHNHCFLATQLVTTNYGDVPIVDVKAGDLVLTRNGYRTVLRSWKTASNQPVNIYSITCSIGKYSLSCTSNHNILTQDGWKPISELKTGDCIWVSKNLMAKNTTSTKESDTTLGVLNECTALFGHIIMAQFRKAFTFITKTKTPLTTPSRTLNLGSVLNTFRSIKKSIANSTQKKFVSIWTQFVTSLKSGIRLARAVSGIGNMPNQTTLAFSTYPKSRANNAETHSSPKLQLINTVVTSANRPFVVNQELTTKSERAQSAIKHSSLADTLKPQLVQVRVRQLDVGYLGKHDVYDLHVDTDHEFVAGGVLVHNCMDAIRYAVYTKYHKPTRTGVFV